MQEYIYYPTNIVDFLKYIPLRASFSNFYQIGNLPFSMGQ